jgi:tetratricopeptide (TPR) repeat protein
VILFWNKTEIAGNEDYYFCKHYVHLLNCPLVSFGFFAPFALLGCWAAFGSGNSSGRLVFFIIGCYMVSVVLFTMSARFRFPMTPVMIAMASYGVRELIKAAALLQKRRFIFYIAALICFIFFTNINCAAADPAHNLCVNYNNLGTGYFQKGKYTDAIKQYQKALAIDADYAESYNNLGAVYHRMGLIEKSVQSYQKAISLNPNFADAYFGLANVYADSGRIRESAGVVRKSH